mgnify:CR=1 FL=1
MYQQGKLSNMYNYKKCERKNIIFIALKKDKKFDEFTKINHSLKECNVILLKSTVISHQRLQPRPDEQELLGVWMVKGEGGEPQKASLPSTKYKIWKIDFTCQCCGYDHIRQIPELSA